MKLLPPLFCCLAALNNVAAQAAVFFEQQKNNPTTWHPYGQTIAIQLPEYAPVTKLRFLVNGNDLTELFVFNSHFTFSLVQILSKLPSGENTLEVFDTTTEDWELIHSQALRILSASGFRKASVKLEGGFGVSRQIVNNREANNLDELETEDKQFQNQLELQLSVSSEHATTALNLVSQANIVGSSIRENSLQFSERNKNANKVDLSDYLVHLQGEKFRLSIGHNSVGSNPLLLDSLSNRGLQIAYQINDYIDIAVSQQNGSAIVGWQNLLGQQSEHRISSAVLTSELFPQEAGKMRIELTYVNARTQALADFGVGEVADIEQNQGIGIKLKGKLWQDALGYQISYARSRFNHPNDQALEFEELSQDDEMDFTLAPTSTETSVALIAQVDLALWPQTDADEQFFSAHLTLEHAKYDALYKSIGANSDADLTKSALGLAGNLGQGTWQYRFQQMRNNVDNIPTILTSKTLDQNFNYSIDLGAVFTTNDETEQQAPIHKPMFSALWFSPTINLHVQRTHQFALNSPNADLSDFNSLSHLPDQVSEIVDFSAEWNIDNYSFAYAMSYSFQDNRQLGREQADFSIVNHSARQQWTISEFLSLGLELGRARNADHELNQVFYQNNGLLDINWLASSDWTINVNASKNRDYDNLASSLNKAYTLAASVQYQWQFEVQNQAFSGQWSLRYAKQQNAVQDNQFNFNTFTQNWHVYSGVRVSF